MTTNALILAGGKGTRLKPITDYVPKPLIPIQNTPLLEWQIRYLKRFGVSSIVICTGYLADQIQEFLKVKQNFGIDITVSVEKKPLGTAGAIRHASKHISDSVLVLNGDVITDLDIRKMFNTPNSIAAVLLRTQFGVLGCTGDLIDSFREKQPLQDTWMNAGIYHLNKDILDELPSFGDIEKTTFPKMAKQKRLHVVKFAKSRWFSIDSHKDITECSDAISGMF